MDEIYDHRHDLTHELIKYVVDPNFEPDVDLLADALDILRDLHPVIERNPPTQG